jgi:membrane protein implicated in regulation of membrane protease activity
MRSFLIHIGAIILIIINIILPFLMCAILISIAYIIGGAIACGLTIIPIIQCIIDPTLGWLNKRTDGLIG